MTEHPSHGDGNDEHGDPSLAPSVWPIIAGLSALFLGFSLIWWTRDRGNQFSGPILSASIIASLIAAAGWAYDNVKMHRKADTLARGRGGDSRFTQVVTFSVAPGRLAVARESGIIHEIESTDGALRGLPGFVDLRIIASPAVSGPSQVLVETTWTDREGLATYEQTRRTILDLVGQHGDDVVTGSVQVFDMEVVRDTKEISVRFGLAQAFTVFGALIVGGFMVGAGLTAFQDNTTVAAAPGAETPSAGGNTVVANNNKFDKSALEATAGQELSVTFQNKDKVKHNLHFYDKKNGVVLAQGASGEIIDGGKSETIKFTPPGPGTFYFQCDLHPDQMNGKLTVK